MSPLPVVKGEELAITVPTWAPILTFGLSTSDFSYTQSHTQIITGSGTSKKSSCETAASSTLAQLTLGQQAQYTCSFQGTRVEYTALEVTAPKASASTRARQQRLRRARKHRTRRH